MAAVYLLQRIVTGITAGKTDKIMFGDYHQLARKRVEEVSGELSIEVPRYLQQSFEQGIQRNFKSFQTSSRRPLERINTMDIFGYKPKFQETEAENRNFSASPGDPRVRDQPETSSPRIRGQEERARPVRPLDQPDLGEEEEEDLTSMEQTLFHLPTDQLLEASSLALDVLKSRGNRPVKMKLQMRPTTGRGSLAHSMALETPRTITQTQDLTRTEVSLAVLSKLAREATTREDQLTCPEATTEAVIRVSTPSFKATQVTHTENSANKILRHPTSLHTMRCSKMRKSIKIKTTSITIKEAKRTLANAVQGQTLVRIMFIACEIKVNLGSKHVIQKCFR